MHNFRIPLFSFRNDKSIEKILMPSVTYCHGNLFAFCLIASTIELFGKQMLISLVYKTLYAFKS